MKKNELASVLKNLSPALAKRDLVPAFQCFCFTGKAVFAFDDVIGIGTAFPFDIPGGYRGDHLMAWVNSVTGEDIKIEPAKDGDGSNVKFSCGRSHITLAQLPQESFLFKKPADEGTEIAIDDTIIAAIARVLPCVNRDSTHAWQYGATVYFSAKGVRFYATCNMSAAYTMIKGKPEGVDEGTTLLLPPRFCDILVDFAKSNKLTKFVVYENAAMAEFENGISVYSRIGSEHNVEQHKGLFTAELLSSLKDKLIPIPEDFIGALSRTALVLEKSSTKAVSLSINNEVLTIEGKSALGSAIEKMKVPGHEDASGNIEPENIKPVIKTLKEIALLPEQFLVGKADGTIFVFSLVFDEAETESE